ncbi:alcohol dehydrogenase catalytic domain-containing protein [Pseudomonas fluorescens]|nr:alcohol dehydrogenase catalytic domain-containing protein [Pseudomonas fluorescens]
MKAVMFRNADEPLTLAEVPDPTPDTGDLVVKVGRCGICGTDVHLTQEHGYFPDNSVIGHEFAGEVVALGADVQGFKIGDIVTAMAGAGCGQCRGCLTAGPFLCENGFTAYGGGFAEYARVPARATIKLPSSLSLTDGALVEPLAVSLHALRLVDRIAGKRVLVLGAGSIGLGVVHWARKLGALRVVAASRSRRRASLAEAMGADAFIETGEGEGERVAAALGGLPDIVIECIGVAGALSQSVQLVKPLGTVVSLGFCTKPDPVLPALATFKQVQLLFSMAYSLDEFQFAADMLDRGHVEPRLMVNDDVLALAEVPDIIQQLRKGRADTKLHIDPWRKLRESR